MSQGGEVVDLGASAGYLLKQASAALRVAMEDVLRPLGMTVTRYSCLELLAQRPGLSNSGLARGAFVTRQSMNVLLQTLQKDGLVTRPDRPTVGKVLPVQLTERGHVALREASAAVRAVEIRMLDGLSPADQAWLLDALRSIVRSLGTPDEPAPGRPSPSIG